MSGNKNEHVVMAFFSSREAAEIAANALRDWDHVNKDVKLGSIGLIYKEDGEIKTQMPRSVGRGVVVGVVVGALAAALGPALLLGAAVTGGTLGGVIGAFFKRSVDLDDAALQEIQTQLDAGKVAVVVAVDEHEMTPTAAQLVNAGGTVRQLVVPADAVQEASESMPQQLPQGGDARREDLDRASMMGGAGTLTPLT